MRLFAVEDIREGEQFPNALFSLVTENNNSKKYCYEGSSHLVIKIPLLFSRSFYSFRLDSHMRDTACIWFHWGTYFIKAAGMPTHSVRCMLVPLNYDKW